MKKILVIMLMAFMLAACSKDPKITDKGSKLNALKYSNLAGAKAAFITGGTVVRGASTRGEDGQESFKFYKVGIDDQIQSVTFTDDKGNTAPAITDFVRSLSEKYAVMRVSTEDSRQVCVFIIRKSDGKLFTSPQTLERGVTSWGEDDPLGMFTWDGPDGQGIDAVLRLKDIKTDSDGSLYYIGGGWSYGGTLYKIFEKNGSVQFATIAQVGEYFKRNDAGGILTGNARQSDSGDENRLAAEWLTPNGESYWSEWLVNMGPEYPRIMAGTPFALSFAPGSFFTVDDICDDSNPLNIIWKKSVLAQYTVRDGAVVREVVHEFVKKISHFGVTTSSDGTGLADIVNGFPYQKEVCVIKNISEGGITYVPVAEESHSQHDAWMNFKALSNRYVYGFNPSMLPYHNTISRFDPQTGTDIPNYYTLPEGYTLRWVWATYEDVLTILAEKAGSEVYIEVGVDGTAAVYDSYNGVRIIMRSAF